jgi:hypothetical protein
MIISLCIACMNRTYCLKQTLPFVIKAANASPPVEITVLDYSSKDGLQHYLEDVSETVELADGNTFNYPMIFGEEYFHVAHARNAAVMASHGEYIIQLDTEIMPSSGFVKHIRERIEAEHPVWMCEAPVGCVIVCQRKEFIDAGGYDERFYVYGPEDKDLCARLHRRGGKFETYPSSLFTAIKTSNSEKLQNLDVRPYAQSGVWIKQSMANAMHAIYDQNNSDNVLVANDGKEWGRHG